MVICGTEFVGWAVKLGKGVNELSIIMFIRNLSRFHKCILT